MRSSLWRWNTRWFLLEKVPGGIISSEDEPVWVLFYNCYIHIHSSLPRLLWEAITEFRSDKHLAM